MTTSTSTTAGTTTGTTTGDLASPPAGAPGRRTPAAPDRTTHAPIPFRTVVGVELRKMFDTRSGFWMLTSIVVLATLATAAVLLFAPDSMQMYGNYASAVGIPMAVILPMIAVLSVTSEWSQRSGLTTFTLVPHRGRVIGAKLVCTIGLGVVSMVVAMVVGAVGNVVGSQLAGVDTTWGVSAQELGKIVLAGVLGMLMGFTLGVLFRNSAAAIVGYFVYSLLLPTLSGMLAAFQEWYADAQPWVDFQFTSTKLYDVDMTGTEWLQLAVTGTAWLVVPLTIGLWRVVRSEVK